MEDVRIVEIIQDLWQLEQNHFMLSKKQKLRAKADKLWYSKYLKDQCEVCGAEGTLQGHHFYYRSSYGHLRYSPENHITLCKSCHFLLHHQDPKLVEDKIIAHRGKKWLTGLKKQAQEKQKPSYQSVAYYTKVVENLSN